MDQVEEVAPDRLGGSWLFIRNYNEAEIIGGDVDTTRRGGRDSNFKLKVRISIIGRWCERMAHLMGQVKFSAPQFNGLDCITNDHLIQPYLVICSGFSDQIFTDWLCEPEDSGVWL